MIGSLRGELAARGAAGELLVDVHGVGYRVQVTTSTAASVGPLGEPVFLHVHTHVREDALVLYGFAYEDERRCFEALLGAHGVGPALALAILSVLSPATLSTAVLEDDVDTLCLVPGVGRKTAARLLIDLKSRLNLPDLGAPGPADPGPAGRSALAEVKEALEELGYGPEEIREVHGVLREELATGSSPGTEELLRRALRELAAR